jgi:hypothetical protein
MNNTAALTSTGESGLQIWIQTAEHNMICLQGFAYFLAEFSWSNSVPNHQITRVNFTSDTRDETGWRDRISSVVYTSLLDIIRGNISIQIRKPIMLESQGSIMLTGLRGCDDIADNYWLRNGSVPRTPEVNATFQTTPNLCRNKTLPAALEDLSNNITMSLIGLQFTYAPLS